jgi:Ca2+-binding RTX toxin-like protein
LAKPVWTADQILDQFLRDGESWQSSTISYSFFAAKPASADGDAERSGFVALTTEEQTFVRQAFAMVSDVTNLHFVQTPDDGSAAGGISFAQSTTVSDYAWGFTYTSTRANGSIAGAEIWLSTDAVQGRSWFAGGYNFMALMHEVLHAVGLPHPGDYNADGGTITYADDAIYFQDSRQYSVLSYFDASQTGANFTMADGAYSASTLLRDDIQALQALYGANTTTRAGDTTYGFNATAGVGAYDCTINTHPIWCVWDGGGVDTLDFSGYSMAQRIDLNAGAFSDTAGMTFNISIAYGAAIERAIGGSGADSLTGNALANELIGGAGNDSLTGGAGNDILNGGAGTDTAIFGLALASGVLGLVGGGLTVASSAEGLDTLIGVELLKFTDGVLKADVLGQVIDAYDELFGRDPGASEAFVWQNAFASGSTVTTLRSTLVAHGQDYLAPEVADLYQTFFGRAVTSAEMGYWNSAFVDGADLGTLRATLVGNAYGQAHIASEITGLYQTYFGRAASGDEINVWKAAIVVGDDFADVRAVLVSHPYGQAHIAAETNALYETFFGRAATSGELGVWTDLVVHGSTFNDIRSVLTTNPYGQAHIAAETTALYQTFFGRAANSSEIGYWTSAIVAGAGFDDVRSALIHDPYGQNYVSAETTTLYATYFGRTPASAELAVWKDAFLHGADFFTLTDALMSYGASLGVQHVSATSAQDHFVFTATSADAVISGFTPGQDILALQGLGSDPLAHAHAVTYGGQNDVIIDYDQGLAILLKNVSLTDLHTSDFGLT